MTEHLKTHDVEPEVISPDAYYDLLRTLLYKGKTFGKTKPIAAYSIQEWINKTLGKNAEEAVVADGAHETFKCQTLTNNGREELATSTKITDACLCFDLHFYPDKAVREQIVKDAVNRWLARQERPNDESADIVASGVWVNKRKTLREDYLPTKKGGADSAILEPNPEATRIALHINKDLLIPAPWAPEEFVGKGGFIVMRERDLFRLMQAVEGTTTENKPTGSTLLKTASKLDVYPTEGPTPKEPVSFLLRNYMPVSPKMNTFQLQTRTPEGAFGFAERLFSGCGGKTLPKELKTRKVTRLAQRKKSYFFITKDT